jgi:hypothetical protein
MAGKIPKFRIRLIPVTLLWSLALCQLLTSAWLAGCYFAALISLTPMSDLQSSWEPLFTAAGIAWFLPTGAGAFVAGWFFYRGRWRAASIAAGALLLLCYLCLIPIFLAMANYPGPS